MKGLNRILGILGLLVAVYVLTWIFSDLATGKTAFLSAYNQENVIRRTALYAILGIGVAFVIITGGIDLSIGSVVCLVGVGIPWLTMNHGWPMGAALGLAIAVSAGIGVFHGLLITKLRLPPFIVTLCGLLMYRGIARGLTKDQTQGFQNEFKDFRFIANGEIPLPGVEIGVPVPAVILIVIAVIAAVFLNKTVYGRYLKALGNNQEAARLSGIDTDRMVILSYVICSVLAGLGGLLFVMDGNSAQPVDFGNFYELYAIAAAVLGGCSLRGGSGTILGVIIGAGVMQLLRNAINLIPWISPVIEFAVIGVVILAGVIVDELAKRAVAKRRAR